MSGLAYLFERFPSFTQTFCYREIVALRHAGVTPALFAVRRPQDEPPQDWDPAISRAVQIGEARSVWARGSMATQA